MLQVSSPLQTPYRLNTYEVVSVCKEGKYVLKTY